MVLHMIFVFALVAYGVPGTNAKKTCKIVTSSSGSELATLTTSASHSTDSTSTSTTSSSISVSSSVTVSSLSDIASSTLSTLVATVIVTTSSGVSTSQTSTSQLSEDSSSASSSPSSPSSSSSSSATSSSSASVIVTSPSESSLSQSTTSTTASDPVPTLTTTDISSVSTTIPVDSASSSSSATTVSTSESITQTTTSTVPTTTQGSSCGATNLIQNPSFETGDTSHWITPTNYRGALLGPISPNTGFDGSYYFGATTANNPFRGVQVNQAVIGLGKGYTYKVTLRYMYRVVQGTGDLTCSLFAISDNIYIGDTVPLQGTGSTKWETWEGTFVARGDNYVIQFTIGCGDQPTMVEAGLDDISVVDTCQPWQDLQIYD